MTPKPFKPRILVLYIVWATVGCVPDQAGRSGHYSAGGSFIGGDPVMSPRGDEIVFASPRSGSGDIFLMSREGTRVRRTTSDISYEGQPCWFPKGDRIAFVREQEGIGHIWSMALDGTQQQQLTHGDDYDSAPCISPDGSLMVFERGKRPSQSPDLYLIKLDERRQIQLTNEPDAEFDPSFSSDGRWIYYVHEADELWRMRSDGSGKRRIGTGWSPSQQPGGRWIACVTAPYHQTISMVNLDDSKSNEVFHSMGYKAKVRFTADGGHLLFLDEPQGSGIGDICTIRPDGSDLRRIGSNR